MSRLKDLTGQRFGRLTVIERAENNGKRTMWLCQCDCGVQKEIEAHSLKIGETKSCGCLQRETQSKQASTHGLSKHPLYKKYLRIIDRCENQNSKSYKDYGGRGITMCSEWRNNFKAFYDWCMSNGYRSDLSIDRIDNNGDYSPDNCRWATKLQQDNNRRNNRFIDFNGKKMTVAEWGRRTGLGSSVILQRLNKLGWDEEKALSTPKRRNRTVGTKA